MKIKNKRQLEKLTKGAANHRRIEILFFLWEDREMTLDEIARSLDCHQTTATEHTMKLVRSGLVIKRYEGRYVLHKLSPHGVMFVRFLSTLSKK
jgi:predicted transcriptional regulator